MDYKSHIGQDRWAAEVFGLRRDGYFVELGALDGVGHNNTYALEKDLGWTGIAVEANPTYYPEVCRNRSCIAINAAVWPESRVTVEMVDAHGLSSVVQYKDGDVMSGMRNDLTTRRFTMETINPTELLDRFQAPEFIEYLSLDIEGCELPVIKAVDLSRYKVALMTIEHSGDMVRADVVRTHLASFGYSYVHRMYEDWFYHMPHLQRMGATADPVATCAAIAETFEVEALF